MKSKDRRLKRPEAEAAYALGGIRALDDLMYARGLKSCLCPKCRGPASMNVRRAQEQEAANGNAFVDWCALCAGTGRLSRSYRWQPSIDWFKEKVQSYVP